MKLDIPKQTFGKCDGQTMPKPSRAKRESVKAGKRAEIEQIKKDAAKGAGLVKVRKPIGAKLRSMVLDRDGRKCVLCGKAAKDKHADGSPVTLEVDHILPVAQGGTNCESNLRAACNRCNLGRGARRDPM